MCTEKRSCCPLIYMVLVAVLTNICQRFEANTTAIIISRALPAQEVQTSKHQSISYKTLLFSTYSESQLTLPGFSAVVQYLASEQL